MPTETYPLSPVVLHNAAARLYPKGPIIRRQMQIYRPLICPFATLIDCVPDRAEVLDIGCGSGLFMALLTLNKDIKRVVGFDVSPEAIEVAQEMKRRHPSGASMTFEVKSVTDKWPMGVFDIVSIVDLFHHLPIDLQRSTFAKACDTLKPGGRLILKDVGRRPLWRAFFSVLHDMVVAQEFIRIPSDENIKNWVSENNLRLVKQLDDNMFWYGHKLWLIEKPLYTQKI